MTSHYRLFSLPVEALLPLVVNRTAIFLLRIKQNEVQVTELTFELPFAFSGTFQLAIVGRLL